MEKFKTLAFSFLLGSIVLCSLSVFQKVLSGFPLALRGFYVPFFAGGSFGLLIGIRHYRLLKINEQLTKEMDERKKADEVLRKSEERYRTVSEITSDYAYAYRVNQDGEVFFEWGTGALARITGFTAEEVTSRGGWESLIYPDDITIPLSQLNSLLAGKAHASEYRILTKNGDVRWIQDYASPLWDEKKNRLIKIVGAIQDVTERKRAEEALQKSEAMYRSLFENTGTATLVIEENMTISQVNAKCERLIGYPRDEIEGKMKASDFINDEDLDRIAKYHFGRRDEKGIYPSEYELELVDKHGDTRNAIIQIGMIPATNTSIASIIDVTPLRRAEGEARASEERFRSLVANIPGAVYRCIKDSDWSMLFLSDAIVDICGYPASDFIGNRMRTYASVIHPDDREMVAKAVEKKR